MDLVFMIGLPGIPVVVLLALAFGIKLVRQSSREKIPERQQALEWAGGSLIEPLINTFVVFLLVQTFVPNAIDGLSDNGPAWNLLPQAMLITLPLLFLLKPIQGWTNPDAPSRDLNRALVGIGVLRWAVTVFGLIYLPIVLLGIVVLGLSIIVVASLAGAVTNPDRLAGLAIGAGSEGIKVAPADEFATAEQARALL